ncbi:unnamed protein product [Clonostachys rosea]|uniref:Fungal-type protein kinase domain-containing protein n=1 Tax=Bionectria ochroleuca TaxID=29856 RepID=A0ABY6V0S6_BIOOC|nr:unnamed protein product [Clonostachys rosea]
MGTPMDVDGYEKCPVPDKWKSNRAPLVKSQWKGIRDNLKRPDPDLLTIQAFMRLAVNLSKGHSQRLGSWVIKNRPLAPFLDFFNFMEGKKDDIYYETALVMEAFLRTAVLQIQRHLSCKIGGEYSTAQSYEDFWLAYFGDGGYAEVYDRFIHFNDKGDVQLSEDETMTRGEPRDIEYVHLDLCWVFDAHGMEKGKVKLRWYDLEVDADLYREL